jgi:hypothetical protein
VGGGAAQGLALDGAGHLNLGWVPEFDFVSGTGTVEGWVRADWAGDDAGSDWPSMFANRDGTTRWSLHLKKDKSTLSFTMLRQLLYDVPGNRRDAWINRVVFEPAPPRIVGWRVHRHPSAGLNTNTVTVQLVIRRRDHGEAGWGCWTSGPFLRPALPAASIQALVKLLLPGHPPVVSAQPSGALFWGTTLATFRGRPGGNWSIMVQKDVATSSHQCVPPKAQLPPRRFGRIPRVIAYANGSSPATKPYPGGQQLRPVPGCGAAGKHLIAY